MLNKKRRIVVHVEGMHCEHCAKRVKNVLCEIENVIKVKVNFKKKEAIIESIDEIPIDLIRKQITSLDYQVIDIIND